MILQSLFFYSGLHAQNIFIDAPRPGAPLQDTQEFRISVTDADAVRVDFYLNNRLIGARTAPPWQFTAAWNTRYENTVRFVARLKDGGTLEVTQAYAEIRADIEASLEVFQFFPFQEEPGSGLRMESRGVEVQPASFKPAKGRFDLHLVVVLDVSGSMKFSLADLSPGLHALLKYGKTVGWHTRVLLFDNAPRLIDPDSLPANLEALYVERARSVVYDALATASQMFPRDPRRIMLLISDGGDDGSTHDGESASLYLKKARTPLVWLTPAKRQNPVLTELAALSGGFVMFSEQGTPFPELARLFDTQYHLLAPDAAFPVELKVRRGRIWYPRWPR